MPFCGRLKVQAVKFSGSRDFFHLYLHSPQWACRPGQFVMIRPVNWGNDPVWPRPFSICEKTQDSLRLFIQVVGRGTRLISRLEPDSELDLWGPLGNGFDFDDNARLLLLAGGMGIAPFIELCKSHPRPEKISMLFGHRMGIECYPFSELPAQMRTEHVRQKSLADIEDFKMVLRSAIEDFSGRGRILACGPTPFLKVVQQYAERFKADAWLSLENRMACGVGACLGCVAATSEGDYVQTCTKGPVFQAQKVVLEGCS